MIRRLNFIWRLIGTGLGFFFFSTGGVIFTFLICPMLKLAVRNKAAYHHLVQRAIQLSFKLFIWFVTTCRICRVEFNNKAILQNSRGVIIIANHPTLIDIIFLMSETPNAQCIIKRGVFEHRFYGAVARAANYICNDEDSENMLAQCRRVLNAGDNIIVFPEGTRSIPGQSLQFKRGFANIAVLSGADLQLVRIAVDPPTLIKGAPWWAIPERRFDIVLSVENRIDISHYAASDIRSRVVRRLTRELESLYNEWATL